MLAGGSRKRGWANSETSQSEEEGERARASDREREGERKRERERGKSGAKKATEVWRSNGRNPTEGE